MLFFYRPHVFAVSTIPNQQSINGYGSVSMVLGTYQVRVLHHFKSTEKTA
jgi:hypothetical protein